MTVRWWRKVWRYVQQFRHNISILQTGRNGKTPSPFYMLCMLTRGNEITAWTAPTVKWNRLAMEMLSCYCCYCYCWWFQTDRGATACHHQTAQWLSLMWHAVAPRDVSLQRTVDWQCRGMTSERCVVAATERPRWSRVSYWSQRLYDRSGDGKHCHKNSLGDALFWRTAW